MWLNKTHIGLLTYNSVKVKVNMNVLPRIVMILEISFIAYKIYLFHCGAPWLTVWLILFIQGRLAGEAHSFSLHTALTPGFCTP